MFYAPNAPVPVIDVIDPRGLYNPQFEGYLQKLAPQYETLQQERLEQELTNYGTKRRRHNPPSSAVITRNTDSDRTESEEDGMEEDTLGEPNGPNAQEAGGVADKLSGIEAQCSSSDEEEEELASPADSDDEDDEDSEAGLSPCSSDDSEERPVNADEQRPARDDEQVSACSQDGASALVEARDVGLEERLAGRLRPMDDQENTMAHKAKRLSVMQAPQPELEDLPFNVLTLVGLPKSGVSHLLNVLFNCSFKTAMPKTFWDDSENEDDMAERKRCSEDNVDFLGDPRTTRGVWAAKLRHTGGRHMVVLEIGGFDGDLTEQRTLWDQSITFSLAVSDAIGVSVATKDLSRYSEDSYPQWLMDVLHQIVEIQTKLQYFRDRNLPKARYILYFFLRDWHGDDDELTKIEEVVQTIMTQVWKSANLPPHVAGLKYEDFYEPDIITVPSLLRPRAAEVRRFAQETPEKIFGDMPTAYGGDVSICEFAPFCEQVWDEVTASLPEPYWERAGELLMMARCVALKERIAFELVERIRAERYADFNAYWETCHPRRMVRVAYGEFRLYAGAYPEHITKAVAVTLYESVCVAYDRIVQQAARRLLKIIIDKVLGLRQKMVQRNRFPEHIKVANRVRMLRNFDTFIDGTEMNVSLEDGTRVTYDFYLTELRQWLADTIDEIFAWPLTVQNGKLPRLPDFVKEGGAPRKPRFQIYIVENRPSTSD